MAAVGERSSLTGIFKCSRCGHEILVNQKEHFPACKNCDIPGRKWTYINPEAILIEVNQVQIVNVPKPIEQSRLYQLIDKHRTYRVLEYM